MSRLINYFHEIIIKIRFSHCLNALAQLQQAYFACYGYRDYFSKPINYEKTLYQKRSAWLNKMARAYQLVKNEKNGTKWHSIFLGIDQLSEVFFALHQLRFREKDYSIFEMCSYEMKALDKIILAVLKEAAKKIRWNKTLTQPVELIESIYAFEAMSHRILKVTSSEPIIFLFFIQDLYALNNEINRLYEKIH